ncbi:MULTISPECIES: SCO family protein [Paenibacillus]|uniref:Electron transporter SCO1/SenC n=1 Tax=Paenibacillus naphthalenovorans TaxID=162209 RepID=A0A0U2U249_9BACL|nr:MULTISPECIES: SCO family protein [Paenibacillus]ALS20665.1 electron transporter SCO1/SenC [Paenibacillus naphthalenovorans]NTZ17913.1 redoxin domain-containing protein [Paenibacillus sp. JMULE4]SDI25815.1 protein SCO1/2 [Paenibacillus naphthalenovorans]
MQKNGFKIIVVVLLIGLIATFAYMLLKGPEQEIGVLKKAPEFTLENLDGKQVSLADTAGKAKLIYFYFSTCPDVCIPTTYTLSKIQDVLIKKGAFPDKTVLMSITFDPDRDTPERLKEFSQRYHADYRGWYFLRGNQDEVIKLASDYGVMVVKDPGGETYTHGNLFLLVDGKGDLRTYYSGHDENLDIEKVADDLIQISKDK